MQLFISRGQTTAVYPCYRIDLEKIVRELYTGRLRIVGTWIFEIDFVNGKPVCAICVDPRGNLSYGDKALLHLKRIYNQEKDRCFLEIIQLSEEQIQIDREYAPQSIIEHPELLLEEHVEKRLEELEEEAVPKHTLKRRYPQKMHEEELHKFKFEELDVTELAQLIVRAKYIGKVKSSVKEIIKQYRGIVYLSCMDDDGLVRIVVFDNVVKATRPIDLSRELQCRVFLIENENV